MNRVIVIPALAAMLALSGCATGDTYAMMGGQAHLDCQGDGSITVVLMAGMGDDSTTWRPFRDALGPEVRTCAWDYPGTGESTGTPMTAGVAAASLNATQAAAGINDPAPAGVVSEVQDAGHYVHLDQPEIAADAVLRVLGKVK